MKKILLVTIVAMMSFCFTLPAYAVPVVPYTIDSFATYVGDLDSMIKSGNPGDSQQEETDWANLWVSETVSFSDKVEEGDLDWSETDQSIDVWAHLINSEADYFIIKKGNGLSGDSHYLFENNMKLGYAVIDLTEIGITNQDITGISHLTSMDAVPIPSALLLFGSGLAGLGGLRFRRKRQLK
jgi:hypothetical protein